MKTRRLGLESLENRQLLAGVVTVSVTGGRLLIKGDGVANQIVVTEVAGQNKTYLIEGKAFDGEFLASGLPKAGTAKTQIKLGTSEETSQTITIPAATADKIDIQMGDGNDAVTFGTAARLATTAGLNINTGAGRDYIRADRMKLVGNTSFTVATVPVSSKAAPTPAEILFFDKAADKQADIERVHLTRIGTPLGEAVNTKQNLTVSTGGGGDTFIADNIRLGGSTTLKLGAGGDKIEASLVDLGNVKVNTNNFNDATTAPKDGADRVTVKSFLALSVDIDFGEGNDVLIVNLNTSPGAPANGYSAVTVSSRVNGGAGFDEIKTNFAFYAPTYEFIDIEKNDLFGP